MPEKGMAKKSVAEKVGKKEWQKRVAERGAYPCQACQCTRHIGRVEEGEGEELARSIEVKGTDFEETQKVTDLNE